MESLNAAQSALRALIGILESRFEMFSLETTIEKKKAALLVCALGLAVGCSLLALTFAGIFLILLAPEAYRAHVAGVWMLFNILLAAICLGVITLSLRKGGAPYANTLEELRKDIACLGAVMKSSE
jgi:uncharacterized membrane protein YqjE